MRAEQKGAWLTIVALGISVVVFLILIPILGTLIATSAFALFAISGLAPVMFRDKPMPGEVTVDERDKKIHEKAALGGAMTSYMAFIVSCMVPWFVCMCRGRDVISIHALPMIVMGGGIVCFLARSITLLILYGREGAHGEV